MLRPERMSRVSVTGSKRVMDETIETVHGLNLVDVTDYDGGWEGFEPGDPVEGADAASERLVTVRSLQNILGVSEDEAGPTRIVTDEALEEDLEGVRTEVNELDDRRNEVEDELRAVEEQLDAVRPFVDLGIDLDLLSGYDHLAVAVGEGDEESIRRELEDADDVEAFELFGDGESVAVFAHPADAALDDALVSAAFTRYEVPDADSDPEEYVSELEHRRQQLESRRDTIEGELEELRLEYGGFLLAAEEKLAIEAQKREAPLSFATTENAFVAEGWLPTERFVDLAEALSEAVGDHVEVEELERADYDEHGHGHVEHAEAGPGGALDEADETAVADGGTERAMSGGEPPVVQSNPGPVKPFETLTEVINRPKYSEIDPTVVLFLTFPLFFGFMIGDLGYGLLYMGLGYWLYASFESDTVRALGGVGLLAGLFTVIFGVLYGEIFGLHQLGEIVWGGHPPIEKGLSPATAEWALGWLVMSLVAGIVHLTVGWIIDFYENLSHGFVDALTESGSWLIMMYSLWAWILSGANGQAPGLLYGPESVFNGHPFPFGFTGLPAFNLFTIPVLDAPFSAWLLLFFVGAWLLYLGEPIEVVEFLNVLVNVLSYTRLAAVLLAKAGMAFVVNLLFFGVYVTEETHGGETVEAWHFALTHMPEAGSTYHGHEVTEIMFGGLVHGGIATALVGILVLVFGHLLVLALGITSAGLQAVRLEYVEFFGKFYEGGGRAFDPFGYERNFTTED